MKKCLQEFESKNKDEDTTIIVREYYQMTWSGNLQEGWRSPKYGWGKIKNVI
jgi:hypothetical protein